MTTLRQHQQAAGRAHKGHPKSPEHKAKLQAILADARARKAARVLTWTEDGREQFAYLEERYDA